MKDIRSCIDKMLTEVGDRNVLTYKNEANEVIRKTYSELIAEIEHAADYFAESGIRGKKIVIWGANSYEWIIGFFGIVLSGNIAVPVDYRVYADSVADIINRTGAALMVSGRKTAVTFDEVKALVDREISCIDMKDFAGFEVKNSGIAKRTIKTDPDECCMIMFTSGSTGVSKGVMLSEHNFVAEGLCSVTHCKYNAYNTYNLIALPMFHIFSLVIDISWVVLSGVPGYLNYSFPSMVQECRDFGVTRVCLVPMMAQYVLSVLEQKKNAFPEKSKDEIRKETLGEAFDNIVLGGAYADPAMKEGLISYGIKVYCGYGMTETSSAISSEEGHEPREGSVGVVLPVNEVKIVDGEIWSRGENVMLGYYEDEENTAEILNDGWIMTGDIGYMDEDNYVYITGKKKNLIITANGENVSPEELEKQIYDNEAVKETIVYQKASRIRCAIFPDFEMLEKSGIAPIDYVRSIVEKINAQNPPFKHIHGYEVRETEFEKTSTMKIKREQYYYVK